MEELDFYKANPQFSRMRKAVIYDDLWQQPELSPRDRSLVTCAILAAHGKQFELEAHMKKAISNGVTVDELRGLVCQVAIYAGWPNGVNAAQVGLEIFQSDMNGE